MNDIKTTRYSELVDLIDFAKANGYEGSTEKLNKVLDQWKPKNSKNSANTALAIQILVILVILACLSLRCLL